MCTAIFDKSHGLFGRTLDLEYSYGEEVTIAPRGFKVDLAEEGQLVTKHAIIGVATVKNGYPLYYDAQNETGLAMAALNFPKSARYLGKKEGMINLAPFELILYILGTCENISEALNILKRVNIRDVSFSSEYPASPLHWMIADSHCSFVAEPMNDGLKIYENPARVMTNEPPLPYHLTRLSDYAYLSPYEEGDRYSRGLSAFGLPGDFSSPSRFVRAAFLLESSVCENDATEQFFKILENVSIPRGAVRTLDNKYVITRYSSCMDLCSGSYTYKTYGGKNAVTVTLREKENADSLLSYPLEG